MSVKPYKEQKMLMTLSEHKEKYGTYSRKCTICGKNYKLPGFIFEERMKMCFTCECKEGAVGVLNNFFKGIKI